MNKDIFSGKLGIFIDESNVYHSQKTLGWKIDYLKLKKYFDDISTLKVLNLYTSYLDKNILQKERFKKLEKNGYKVVKKQLKFIKNKEGGFIKKGNLDIELAIDAYRLRKEYNILVLFSGDSDFEYLLRLLKRDNIKIIVVSTGGHVSRELLKISDEYIDLKKIKEISN